MHLFGTMIRRVGVETNRMVSLGATSRFSACGCNAHILGFNAPTYHGCNAQAVSGAMPIFWGCNAPAYHGCNAQAISAAMLIFWGCNAPTYHGCNAQAISGAMPILLWCNAPTYNGCNAQASSGAMPIFWGAMPQPTMGAMPKLFASRCTPLCLRVVLSGIDFFCE